MVKRERNQRPYDRITDEAYLKFKSEEAAAQLAEFESFGDRLLDLGLDQREPVHWWYGIQVDDSPDDCLADIEDLRRNHVARFDFGLRTRRRLHEEIDRIRAKSQPVARIASASGRRPTIPVTREQIEAEKQRRIDAGEPAGYVALAGHFHCHASTIRRRLHRIP